MLGGIKNSMRRIYYSYLLFIKVSNLEHTYYTITYYFDTVA
jgi:hypothetical protein